MSSNRRGSRMRVKNFRIDVERLESRLLLATDFQLPLVENSALFNKPAHSDPDQPVADTGGLEFNVNALELLPGDTAVGAAEGHQMDAEISRGGSQFLAVWSDYRTSPDDFPPFATADIVGQLVPGRAESGLTVDGTMPKDAAHEQSLAAWSNQSVLGATSNKIAVSPEIDGRETQDRNHLSGKFDSLEQRTRLE